MAAIPSRRSERDEQKKIAQEFARAAIHAVDPDEAVRRVLHRDGDTLSLAGQDYDLRRYRRIVLVGAGKAAAAMARAVEAVLGDLIDTGLVVVKRGYAAKLRKTIVVEASHPVPDASSQAAATDLTALVNAAGAEDLVICLLSGGASALLASPAHGIALADKSNVTEALLRAGATITELNAVRKHLSALKGGGLARLAAPATLITLVLSDVVGSPLDVIASGPTVPDPTSFADAYDVLAKYGLLDVVPDAVVRRMRDGVAGLVPETPKPGSVDFSNTQTVIVGSNESAALAVVEAARARGWQATLLSTFVEGEAREVGRVFAAIAKEIAYAGRPLARPACVVAGGETTVTVRGAGTGGRNQELALAAALQLEGWADVAVVSLATDGTDGPTDAAGAYADGDTLHRARAAGIDVHRALAENDSYTVFAALGDLIVTGPTLTNVNDIIFVLAF